MNNFIFVAILKGNMIFKHVTLSLSTALGKALNHSITAHIEICIIPLGTTTTRGKATSIGTYTIAADVEFTVVITTYGL